MVRRLPVIQSKPDDAAPERPSWHWILIGAGFVLTIWLPLLVVALWGSPILIALILDITDPTAAELSLRAANASQRALWIALTAGPALLSFMLANLGAGVIVGRFGGRAGAQEAALGAAVAAAAAGGLAALGSGLDNWPILVGGVTVLLLVGAALSGLGALVGRRWRPKG
jgi:tRNA-(ms[2]io[6]A)-hydroxylase